MLDGSYPCGAYATPTPKRAPFYLYLVNGYVFFVGDAWSRNFLDILESLQITHVLPTTPTANSNWSMCASNA